MKRKEHDPTNVDHALNIAIFACIAACFVMLIRGMYIWVSEFLSWL